MDRLGAASLNARTLNPEWKPGAAPRSMYVSLIPVLGAWTTPPLPPPPPLSWVCVEGGSNPQAHHSTGGGGGGTIGEGGERGPAAPASVGIPPPPPAPAARIGGAALPPLYPLLYPFSRIRHELQCSIMRVVGRCRWWQLFFRWC